MLDYLVQVCSLFMRKAEGYYANMATISQKKNIQLFHFEEANLRHFYLKLKEYFKEKQSGGAYQSGADVKKKMMLQPSGRNDNNAATVTKNNRLNKATTSKARNEEVIEEASRESEEELPERINEDKKAFKKDGKDGKEVKDGGLRRSNVGLSKVATVESTKTKAAIVEDKGKKKDSVEPATNKREKIESSKLHVEKVTQPTSSSAKPGHSKKPSVVKEPAQPKKATTPMTSHANPAPKTPLPSKSKQPLKDSIHLQEPEKEGSSNSHSNPPPTSHITSVSNQESGLDIGENEELLNNISAVKGIIEDEFNDQSLFSQDPKSPELKDIKFGDFDEENKGELIDSIEAQSLAARSKVPVFSETLADAVLEPIDEDVSSSLKESELTDMESELDSGRPERKSYRTENNEPSYTTTPSTPKNNNPDLKGSINRRKTSISSKDVEEVTTTKAGLTNLMKEYTLPELQEKKTSNGRTASTNITNLSTSYQNSINSKKTSLNPSSASSRESSTRKLSIQAKKAAILNEKSNALLSNQKQVVVNNITSSSSTKVATAKKASLLSTFDDLVKRTEGACLKFMVYYVSIIVLTHRQSSKAALKEINYMFNLGVHHENLFLACQAGRLKSYTLLFSKKYEESMRFLDLVQSISKKMNWEIENALSLFGQGYAYFSLANSGGAKLKFLESRKKYHNLGHIFGEYFSLRFLIKMSKKDSTDNDIKIMQEQLKELNSQKNIKTCLTGGKDRKGFFIMRIHGELCSLMIEMSSKIIASSESAAIAASSYSTVSKTQTLFKYAKTLNEEYCK
jgi:hypothetical protein